MVKYKYDEKGKKVNSKIKGYVSATEKDKYAVKEKFKGEVLDKPVRFPRALGAEHPFNFEDVEKTYEKIGIVSAAINKMTDAIVGDFSIRSKDEKARKILEDFTNNTDFAAVLREWIGEGLLKGNGFMEMDIKEEKVRVLNANQMYVKRNRKGKVLGYNQWMGNLNRFTRKSKKLIPFRPEQIIHLRINKVAGKAYGVGIVYPNERVIENLILNEEDVHKVISRKAGAPIHAKVGVPGEAVNTTDVDAIKDNLDYLTNATEWVTDANVEFKVVDFGQLGKSLTDTLDHDMQTLAFGMEIPIVVWGAGNVTEGLAKVQLEVLQRKQKSMQEGIESMIEEVIFQAILKKHNIKADVEFIWNLPSEEEISKRIEKLTKLIENFNVSEPMRRMCELEVARLLDLEDAPLFLPKPEKESKAELDKKKQPPVQPGQPPNPRQPPKKEEMEIKRAASGEMTIREFVNITKAYGDYSSYLISILRRLRVDKFVYLRALNATDLKNGKLPSKEIEKLRNILKEGFRRNKTIAQVTSEIKESVNLKDVLKNGKVVTKAKLRPKMIARTETVRLANLGIIDTYKEQKIEKVRWLAVVSDRTCPVCEGLDGQVFDINTVSPPPRHVDCRCSLLSVE
jgi:SPP1 gp7 family putative phage head morphogenesis protein